MIRNASINNVATRRLITSFLKESCIRLGTPKAETVKMLDKHSKWLARLNSKKKVKIRGRSRKLDVQAEHELITWFKNESLIGYDPTCSEVTAKAQ